MPGTHATIGHLSDSHISAEFAQRTNDLRQCVQHLNRQETPPDVVIHSGDIADYGQAGQYALARAELDQLRMPYYVMVGNRDSRDELRRAFADHQYLAGENKFIQYSIEHLSVRILVLDTLCDGNKKGQLCDARLDHLRQMLDADTSRPAVVFMHHPPFEATEIPDPFQYVDWGDVDRFGALLAQYDTVQAIYCGHVHRNIRATVGRTPVQSVSCVAGDLRWGIKDESERSLPMFRVLGFGSN